MKGKSGVWESGEKRGEGEKRGSGWRWEMTTVEKWKGFKGFFIGKEKRKAEGEGESGDGR